MKKILVILSLVIITISCNEKAKEPVVEKATPAEHNMMTVDDGRTSLGLNAMQKNHQLSNMRSHLEAVQTIVSLVAVEDFDKASKVAYEKLGSTTEMKLMCASFGNEAFENLGLEFHKSADSMSEVLKTKDKKKSLEALATTMNYCIQCHTTFKQ
jgi:hypothetical protein